MKVNYNAIIQSYENIIRCITNDFAEYSYAYEAAGDEQQDIGNNEAMNAKKNPNTQIGKLEKTFGTTLKNIVDKIVTTFKRLITKLSNRLQLIWESDKRYKKELRTDQISIKPIKGVQVISYRYNTAYLKSVKSELHNAYQKIMIGMTNMAPTNTVDELKDLKKSNPQAVINIMIQKATKNSSLSSASEFYNEIKNKFRGEKKKMSWTVNQLQTLIAASEELGTVRATLEKCKSDAQNFQKNLERVVRNYQHQNKGITDNQEKVKLISQITERGLVLSTFYTTAMEYIAELETERVLAYRSIVKRFYNR